MWALCPKPPEFTALGPEWVFWFGHNGGTWAEDRAPQECDPSAGSSAGMAGRVAAQIGVGYLPQSNQIYFAVDPGGLRTAVSEMISDFFQRKAFRQKWPARAWRRECGPRRGIRIPSTLRRVLSR